MQTEHFVFREHGRTGQKRRLHEAVACSHVFGLPHLSFLWGGGVVCMAFLPVGCSAVPAHTAPPSGLFTSQAVPQVGLVSVLKARSADGSCAFLVSQGPFSTKQPPAV